MALFVTIFEWFPFRKWPFKTGQDNRNSLLGLSKGCPRPLNRGDRLIEEKITIIKGHNFRDFDNWPLNGGWPLYTVPLNTGFTVIFFQAKAVVKYVIIGHFRVAVNLVMNARLGAQLFIWKLVLSAYEGEGLTLETSIFETTWNPLIWFFCLGLRSKCMAGLKLMWAVLSCGAVYYTL